MRAAVLRAHGAVPELGEFEDPDARRGPGGRSTVAGRRAEPRRRAHRDRDLPDRAPRAAVRRRARRASDAATTARGCTSTSAVDAVRGVRGAHADRGRRSGYPIPDGLDAGVAVCLGDRRAWRPGWAGVARRAAGRARPCSCSARAASSARSPSRRRGCWAPGAWWRRRAAPSGLERATRARGRRDRAARRGGDLAAALTEAPGAGSTSCSTRCGASPPSPRWPRCNRSAATCSSGSRRARRRRSPPPAIRGKPVSIVGHTNFTADRGPPRRRLRAHGRARRGGRRSRSRCERVPLDEVAEAWRRQGESPNRKLVIVP